VDLPGDLLERSGKKSARLLALYFLEEAWLSPRSHPWAKPSPRTRLVMQRCSTVSNTSRTPRGRGNDHDGSSKSWSDPALIADAHSQES